MSTNRPNPSAFIASICLDADGRAKVYSDTPWLLPDPNPFPRFRLFTLRRKAKR